MLVKVVQGQYSIATAPQTRPVVVDSEYTACLMGSDAITATIKPSTRYYVSARDGSPCAQTGPIQ